MVNGIADNGRGEPVREVLDEFITVFNAVEPGAEGAELEYRGGFRGRPGYSKIVYMICYVYLYTLCAKIVLFICFVDMFSNGCDNVRMHK